VIHDGDEHGSGSPASDRLFGGPGGDLITSGNSNETIHGGSGHDVLDAGTGLDTLSGGSGRDKLFGGPWIDTYRLTGDGDQVVDTGASFNWVDYRHAPSGVLIDVPQGLGGLIGSNTRDQFTGKIAGGTGTRFVDTFIGNDRYNNFVSRAGNDTVVGNGGFDWFEGGKGDDHLDGGPGARDILNGGPGLDTCLNGERLTRCEVTSP
jgi:Ca2+-binding RTX toxin-like protein